LDNFPNGDYMDGLIYNHTQAACESTGMIIFWFG